MTIVLRSKRSQVRILPGVLLKNRYRFVTCDYPALNVCLARYFVHATNNPDFRSHG